MGSFVVVQMSLVDGRETLSCGGPLLFVFFKKKTCRMIINITHYQILQVIFNKSEFLTAYEFLSTKCMAGNATISLIKN